MTQTFLPSWDFWEVGRVLDDKRLNSQQMEAIRVLRVLLEGRKGWSRSPAVLMWKDHEGWLAMYAHAIINSWTRRHQESFWSLALLELEERFPEIRSACNYHTPPWLGDPDFHRSHQSNLVRKDPGHYRQYFPDVPDDLPYVWPVHSVHGVIHRVKYSRR